MLELFYASVYHHTTFSKYPDNDLHNNYNKFINECTFYSKLGKNDLINFQSSSDRTIHTYILRLPLSYLLSLFKTVSVEDIILSLELEAQQTILHSGSIVLHFAINLTRVCIQSARNSLLSIDSRCNGILFLLLYVL